MRTSLPYMGRHTFRVAGVTASAPWVVGHRYVITRGLIMSVALLFTFAVACSTGTTTTSRGADSTVVTVPDDIAGLNAAEVESRLERLVGSATPAGNAAPGLEPTMVSSSPTLDEILEALNTSTPAASPAFSGELIVTIGQSTLEKLSEPWIAITAAPSHGVATVISESQILYVPDGSDEDRDQFEYELFDGDRSVISQIIEINRRQAKAEQRP